MSTGPGSRPEAAGAAGSGKFCRQPRCACSSVLSCEPTATGTRIDKRKNVRESQGVAGFFSCVTRAPFARIACRSAACRPSPS